MKTRLILCLVTLALACPALAQENLLYWMAPQAIGVLDTRLGELKPRVNYTAAHFCQQGVEDSPESVSYQDHLLTFSIPVLQGNTRDLAIIGRAGVMDIDTRAALPRSGDTLPGHLWDLQAGLAYRRLLDNGHTVGGSFTIGSPSDKPFASDEEIVLNLNAFWRIPHGEKNAFVFLLNWTHGREFADDIPLPGFAYYYDAGDNLKIFAGVPFSSVAWEPLDRLIVTASYGLLRNAEARVTYRLTDTVNLYAGWDWDTRVYFRHDRADDDDQLIYHEKKASLGVRWNITRNVYLDCSGGYAYQRFFAEEDDFDDHTDNQIELGDGPYVALTLGVQF